MTIDHSITQTPVVRMHADKDSLQVSMCSFIADTSSGHVYFDYINLSNVFTEVSGSPSVQKQLLSYDLGEWV